jgi:hypothetical protein
MAKYHPKKGAIWLFCKFEIFQEEIAGNGASLFLDFSGKSPSWLFTLVS